MRNLKLKINQSKVLVNIYEAQLKKINAAFASVHEDLQRDYEERIDILTLR
jgi:hypothetical protein